ncbi:MAG: hypothetical protein ACRCW1_10345 [Anaerotignaceae bacterium]
MDKKFPSIYNLVDEDPNARKYFNSLSGSIKTRLEDKAKYINTFEALRTAAEDFQNKN